MAEQGRLQRATRIISTGPGAGPGTGDTWGYARDRPRPRARLPQGSALRSRPPADGQGPPLAPSFPSPFPLHSPTPRRAHPHFSPRPHTLPRALAARVFQPWPGDRQLRRATTAVQPETCRPAVESMQAPASGSGDESLRPVSVVPTFVPSQPFCSHQGPSLTPTPAPHPSELEPIVRVPRPRRKWP